MNTSSPDMFIIMLIAAYLLAGALFLYGHRKGKSFVAAFDKAAAWGGVVFFLGCGMEVVARIALD